MIPSYQIIAPAYVLNYISLIQETDIQEALNANGKSFRKLLKHVPSFKTDYAYATDKWTLRELVQHTIDTERVFSYRALWFARKDPSPLPGFEENDWAANAHGSARDWEDLMDEFKSVRKATAFLFASFRGEELNYQGLANNNPITVSAIGLLCAGHVQHHMNIINERYL